MAEPEYLLDNADPETRERFVGLERTFDPLSIAHLQRVGVGLGAHCLEIGTGGGSLACWMAAQVGPSGHVLAVDLDTRWFQHDGSPQLEVRQVDIVKEPIDGPWDLIHERLVLQHIPARLEVLDQLVASLAPGGWIVLEDFDTGVVHTTDRDGPSYELRARLLGEFNRLLGERGGANDFAVNALRHLRQRGLVETGASGYLAISAGGGSYAHVVAANARQVRDGFLAHGVSAEDVDRYLALLDDPDTILGSPLLMTAWGRKPV
jgi:SAM-dependent methyltransferase